MLRRTLPDHDGTIAVIGTPGEEAAGGKIIELEHGVFDDVDAATMFHPGDRTLLWRHSLAAADLQVQFHGLAAHAARFPHEGRNALAAATNRPAVHLWRSLGFEVLATVPEAFDHAEHGLVGLHVMHRRLV